MILIKDVSECSQTTQLRNTDRAPFLQTSSHMLHIFWPTIFSSQVEIHADFVDAFPTLNILVNKYDVVGIL
jgi:hypothetical protein